MKIGYARISTDKQSLILQRHALTAAGCAEVFEDGHLSGAVTDLPGLDAALARLGTGDVLVVWKLAQLGQSLPHLIAVVRRLGVLGAGFASLSEDIDTTTEGGKVCFRLMDALAGFGRTLTIDRLSTGVDFVKKRRKDVGRPRKLTPEQVAHAREAIDRGLHSPTDMAGLLGVDHSTLWRSMRRLEANANGR